MTAFPTLKTGAIAQYPLEGGIRFATQAVRFLDGSQQRFSLYGTGLHRWSVQLSNLDEQELNALSSFVELTAGATFPFTDPVTGVSFTKCVIAGGRFDARMVRECSSAATLVIEEVA